MPRLGFFRLLGACTLLAVCLPAMTRAQSSAASITGLVTDETGGAVPSVTITATNQATSVAHTAVSNDTGNYTISAVPIGTYVVKAELSGFRTAMNNAVTLEARQVARLDFKLRVGGLQEAVEVAGTSPILQTETPTVGEVISGNTVASLPLNGRNTGQLA
ncbi:MAG: carboxypeptidase regulatory-like domain-containing protein, partial [Acidobacteria bacterium]|nr:carboxypeptidase regulatory-like domain-containing protein [Acidobacteriota bacterium]